MSDSRRHRGAHPEDRKLFARNQLPQLRDAVNELSWLLTRAYTMKGALKLVGDKFSLTERQRLAISRAACADQSKFLREAAEVSIDRLRDEEVIVDGFNLLITIEAALSSGVLMFCRDGCIRDLSSVHGSYRSVHETNDALEMMGAGFEELNTGPVFWLLDSPVSNSGRLAARIRDLAAAHNWRWQVETVFNPDQQIISSDRLVISSDGPLLDRVPRWLNFTSHLVEKRIANAWLIDLS